jgi:two-component system nitrate/nitrite response regulator NarL
MSSRPGRYRVAIVEDHALFAQVLQVALERAGYEAFPAVVDGSTPASSVAAAVARKRPDAALVDLNLGRAGDGTSVITPLARAGTRVIAITGYDDKVRWGHAVAAGAATVMSKVATFEEIVDVLARCLSGATVLDPRERELLLHAYGQEEARVRRAREGIALLTARELEVLTEIARGRTVREIARDAVVAEATVRTQVKSLLAKLGVQSQLEAVAAAHQHGLLSRQGFGNPAPETHGDSNAS